MIDLAAATQSAMYLDEYNNLSHRIEEYVIPDVGARESDLIIAGNDGAEIGKHQGDFNSGQGCIQCRKRLNTQSVTFSAHMVHSIRRCINHRTRLGFMLPACCGRPAETRVQRLSTTMRHHNQHYANCNAAIKTLTADIPQVIGRLVYNTIDVGEAANYVARYNGYLYANGEIIKYDAVQYSVTGTGNVWINSVDEYQNYLLALPFNGKMYPTGLIKLV